MFRACELKDQTYKKTRTLHFSECWGMFIFEAIERERSFLSILGPSGVRGRREDLSFFLAHRNRSDFFSICDCDAHRRAQESQRFPRQEKAALHCDLRVRWKVASDLRFRGAINFRARIPFFLRDFWRFGSVNAQKSLAIGDCDCAILVR